MKTNGIYLAIALLLAIFFTMQARAAPIQSVYLSQTIDISGVGGVPVGIAHDSSNNGFWIVNIVTNSNGQFLFDVIHVARDGSELSRFSAPPLASAFRGISLSADGSVIYLVGDVPNGANIFSFSRSGVLNGQTSLTGVNFRTTNGIAVSTTGDIWVTDFDGSELARFSSDGALQQSTILPFSPGNIALDPSGTHLYVAALAESYIYTINLADFSANEVLISPRDTSIGLGLRMGLAASQDQLFAMDTGWKHIQVYSSVPEPTTIYLTALGIAILLRSRSKT